MRFLNFLNEKLIVLKGTKSKNYGNIIILAGGAASGKGFATQNFLEANLFKIRDIDEVKRMFLEIDRLKKLYPEIRGLDLKNPNDVGTLHAFVAGKNIKDKTFDLLMADAKPGQLPNIIFDITFKDIKGANFHWIKMMIDELGYSPKDVNLIWVLTNYTVAMKANKERDRVVPADMVFKSHEGAALNMVDVIKGKVPEVKDKSLFDGAIHVILNNREHTLFWADAKGNTTDDPKKAVMTKPSKEQQELYKKTEGKKGKKAMPVIKDFKYLTLKEKGKPITSNQDVLNQLMDWIHSNVPASTATKVLWPNYKK
jgi:hypothetical protein